MTEPVQFAAPEPAPTPTPVTTPVVTPKKGRGSGLTNLVLVVAALVAVGGVAFAAGRAMAPTASAAGFQRGAGAFPNGEFPNGALPDGSFDPGAVPAGGFGGGGSRTITGTVKSVDGTTMVVTTANGTDARIDISGSTYHAETAATAADVTAGSSVKVSVEGFGGFRGQGAGAAPGASPDPNASAGAGSGSITATDILVTSGQ